MLVYKVTNEDIVRQRTCESTHPKEYHELLKPITANEVHRAAHTLKNNKGVGNDGVANEFYKFGPASLHELLAQIINTCIDNEYTPDDWKEGRIWLIYKKDSPYEPGNFRPITLLRTSFKIFTKILYHRLYKLVENLKKIGNNQGGFRKYRSCQK
jgi:hypothetical protein